MKAGLIKKSSLCVCFWVLTLTIRFIGTDLDATILNPYLALEVPILLSFIINELVSLVENLGLMGYKLPDSVTSRFRQLKEEDTNGKG